MAVTVQVRERVGFHRDVYNSLVKCLIRQRKTGEFCDVVLRLGCRCYYAHRAVLAAASPYFRSMFSACMKEQGSEEIDLTQSLHIDIDDSFKRVLDFMYCGDIEINIDNVEDILRIADFLLFEDVKDYCRQFFLVHGNLNLSNCLWVSVVTEHHSLVDVADVAWAMVRCRFHDNLVFTDEILDVPAEIFARLLGDAETVRFISGDGLIRVMLRWVRHDSLSRQSHLKCLLKSIARNKTMDVLRLIGIENNDIDIIHWLSKMTGMQSSIDEQHVSPAMQDVKDNGAYIDDEDDEDDLDLSEDLVGTILQANESTDSVIIALNTSTTLKFFRIYVYDIACKEWRVLPLYSEAALGVIPSRLNVCSAVLHANVLFMLLSHDLPYPSDLQRINILAFDVGRGRLALLTFHQRRNRRAGTTTATHLQTSMTDVRSVPPVLVHCAGCLCVVGNVDAVGSVFVCDLSTSVFSCYAIPGVRFVSLARAAVGDDRFVYIWCRHRFGLEAYCVNREVSFAAFDIRRRAFLSLFPSPPGVGYDDFASAGHVLCVTVDGKPVVHSPGRRSYYLDIARRQWIACGDSLPSVAEYRVPAEMPYRGFELYTSMRCVDSDRMAVYAMSNAAPYITSLTCFTPGSTEPVYMRPPPVDGIGVITASQLTSSFCAALPIVSRFDESFTRLIHKKSRQLYDVDQDENIQSGRQTADTDSSDTGSEVEDGLEYDDDIYGYFDDYEYERSVNLL